MFKLVEFLSYDLDQEMRATYLRIESYIKTTLHQQSGRLQQIISSYLTDWTVPGMDDPIFETAGIPAHLEKNQLHDLKSLTKYFKNSRHFFENEGSKKLREALEQMLDKPMTDVLTVNKEATARYYLSLFNEIDKQQQDQIEKDCSNQIYAYQQQLIMTEDILPVYEQTLASLQGLLENNW